MCVNTGALSHWNNSTMKNVQWVCRAKQTMLAVAGSLFVVLGASTALSQMYFPPVQDTTWETVSRAELGWCDEHLDSLYRYLADNATRGFIVLKDGRIAIEWYPDTVTRTNFWYWASAGKSLTATLVGIAEKEGYLNINDASNKYLGEGWTNMTAEQENKVTIWHHLTMTSGIDDNSADMYCTQPTCFQYRTEPGTRWSYNTAVYTMLDGVIKDATGRNINEYLNTKIKSVTGMDGMYIKSGDNNVMYSTPRSMARFGLLALNGFRWNGGDPLLEDEYAHNMVNTSQQLNLSYGYLWWLNGKSSFMIPGLQIKFPGSLSVSEPPDAYNGLGKNDQIVSVVPSMGMVVVRMGDDASPSKPEVATVLLEGIWKRLRAVMCSTTSVSEHAEPDTWWSALPNNTSISVYDVMGRIVSRYATIDAMPLDVRSRCRVQCTNDLDTQSAQTVNVLALY